MSEVIHLNKESFQQAVANADKPVLVDFWASWCGPCKMLAPVLEDIAQNLDDQVVIAKVNVDEERELAESYKIMSIPTMYIFKDNKVVDRLIGFTNKENIINTIKKHI